jgi:hypothetical protein
MALFVLSMLGCACYAISDPYESGINKIGLMNSPVNAPVCIQQFANITESRQLSCPQRGQMQSLSQN